MPIIKIQDETHWHTLRRCNIGSSDAASLFDKNKFESSYSLWLKKRGLIESSDNGNDRSEWGKRFEAPIAYGLAEDCGFEIKKAEYYQHDTISGMGCTPDFIIKHSDFAEIDENERMQGDGIFEIKNLEYFGYFAEFSKDEANHYIEIQIQHQLACTGLKWAALGVKMPGQTPIIKFIRFRDEDFIKVLEKKVCDFWASAIPPEPDGSDSSSEAVRELYRRLDRRHVIDLSESNQIPCLISDLDDLKLKKKPLNAEINIIEKQEKSIKNQIMALSCGAEVVKFQGGEVTIKTINKKEQAAVSYQQISYSLNKEETL